MKLFKRRGNRQMSKQLSGPRRLEMVTDKKETKKMEKMENNNSKPDTIQVDPMKVAEATIAFMNVDNANLNLVNKRLIAENKILEIMGLVGVSPKEYAYNPQTGLLEKVKEPVKEPVAEPTPDPTPTPTA